MNTRALAAAVILLLSVPPAALVAAQPVSQPAPPAVAPNGTGSFVDHGIELMNSADRITLSGLKSQTGGNLSVPAFEKVIQSNLLSIGVRRVLLDIGWQNYTVGAVPAASWVSNWLTACDVLGVQNLLYLGQLTQVGYGSAWAKSLVAADPEAQTYFYNGTAADYFSVDNPDVAKAVEVDLQTLYSYYGSHPSWVGLGSGYPLSDAYFPTNSTMPIMGYSNATLQAFASSLFFSRDANQSGFNSTGDLLYSSFKVVEPSQQMASGVWMTSSGKQVYGNQTTGYRVAMRFALLNNETAIQLGWYGDAVGRPGDLVAQVVRDQNGSLVINDVVATATEPASNIGTTAGWQPDLLFRGNFSAGAYWVIFSSPSSDSSNFVKVYIRDYQVGGYVAYYQTGPSKLVGYPILWIKDAGGADLGVDPYQDEYIPERPQTFIAKQSFSFNTVFLFLSDRHYDPTNGTLVITDLTDGNSVVATGVLSQALTHGLQNWTPIQLDKVVTTVSGDNYSITITEPQNGVSWSVVVRGVTTDPPSSGFQGQSSSWLFRLELMNWGQTHFSYSVITSNGVDGVRSGHPDAIRFSPSQNETVESVSLLMRNSNAAANATYSSGSLTLSIWTSAPNGSSPLQQLDAVSITGSEVPENAWLNSSALHESLVGGEYYWLVLSTNSSSSFTLARLTSPFQSSVMVSDDGGRTWVLPAEGPSEYSYSLALSKETLGPAVSDIPQVQLSPMSEFGQPVEVSAQTQVKGVYLGVFDRQSSAAPNDHILVSIRPDDGKGAPSQEVLASGVYYGDNVTFYSPDYVAFTSVARLAPGQTYWIVVQPVGGNYYVFPDVYLSRAPAGSANAMVSQDSGFTWKRYSNSTTTLSYMLSSPVQPALTFDTAQLYQDLQKFHDVPVANGTLRGWPAYIQTSQLAIASAIASWFDQETGKGWVMSVSAQPSVLQNVDHPTLTPLPVSDTFTTCGQVEQYLLTELPLSNTQLYDIGSLQLLQSCSGFLSTASFGKVLSYLQFFPTPTETANSPDVIWQTGGGTAQSPNLYYSLSGTVGGPLVIWVSNAGGQPTNFSLAINATQVGLRGQWVVMGLNDSTIATGSGDSLTINREIPADSWYPLIVGSYNGNFVASYADATIQRQLQYPNQGLYSIGGSRNQSVVLLISSTDPVGGVSIDSRDNLTAVAATSFYSSKEGWYYDGTSRILLVKFQSSGNDTVRVLSSSPPGGYAPTVPTTEWVFALTLLFAAEGVVAVYIFASRRSGRQPSKGSSAGGSR